MKTFLRKNRGRVYEESLYLHYRNSRFGTVRFRSGAFPHRKKYSIHQVHRRTKGVQDRLQSAFDGGDVSCFEIFSALSFTDSF